jgi:aminoglycoside/choline kinase family phosphotransferase
MSDDYIQAFLDQHGYGAWSRTPLKGDASTRRYERLSNGRDMHRILMIAPIDAEAPSEPDGASEADRRALGYNAIARLAGPNPQAFACLANALRQRGFHAPKIFASNISQGLMILEDFGDRDVATILRVDPSREAMIYEKAVDILAAIYRSTFPQAMPYEGAEWIARAYDTLALQAEADLLLEWYAPFLGREIDAAAKAEWHQIWRDLFNCLNRHAPGLALRDFHAENIFWLSEQITPYRIGLIDFQDALFAHPAYDLVSLIEDARRDVDPELADPLIARFCEKAGIADGPDFRSAYAVMGAQRNAKILGIFVRLAQRDGKQSYLDLMPRVTAHFQRDLSHPALADIHGWFKDYLPEALS